MLIQGIWPNVVGTLDVVSSFWEMEDAKQTSRLVQTVDCSHLHSCTSCIIAFSCRCRSYLAMLLKRPLQLLRSHTTTCCNQWFGLSQKWRGLSAVWFWKVFLWQWKDANYRMGGCEAQELKNSSKMIFYADPSFVWFSLFVSGVLLRVFRTLKASRGCVSTHDAMTKAKRFGSHQDKLLRIPSCADSGGIKSNDVTQVHLARVVGRRTNGSRSEDGHTTWKAYLLLSMFKAVDLEVGETVGKWDVDWNVLWLRLAESDWPLQGV